MIVIDADEVRERLTMPRCIDAVDRAMRALSRGDIVAPLRTWMTVAGSETDSFGLMPGSTQALDVYGAKIISLHPDNGRRDLPVIQGFVALFDRQTGTPVALVDGASVTAIRTAAASALATRELARPESMTHGIFGTGVQAVTHIDAIAAVRPIARHVIWGRDPAKASALAKELSARTGFDIVATQEPRDAADCDVVSTVTAAREPVLSGDWIRPGTHVNLVGAHEPDTREADSDLIGRARVYVDWLESALKESGDLLIPVREGRIGEDHVVGEIGAVLNGSLDGRRDDEEVTVYVSLGTVAQDLFAAALLLETSAATTPDFQR